MAAGKQTLGMNSATGKMRSVSAMCSALELGVAESARGQYEEEACSLDIEYVTIPT